MEVRIEIIGASRKHPPPGDDWPALTSPGERYKAIVQREWGHVRRAAHRCGVPPADCDDIAVEVFLRYQKHLLTITSPFKVRAWLRGAARLLAHEHFATPASLHEELLPSGRLDALEQATCLEERYFEEERLQALRALVDRLPPDQRKLFVAYTVDGLSIGQIGERLGLPTSTVFNRLRGLQEHLRAALNAPRPRASSGTGRRSGRSPP